MFFRICSALSLTTALASASVLIATTVILSTAGLPATALAAGGPGPLEQRQVESVVVNDNRRPAGLSDGSTWRIDLRAAYGWWRPQDPEAAPRLVEAFGEASGERAGDESRGALSVPAPLIRVRTGTLVFVTIRNDLTTPLQVYGLCPHGDGSCPALDVPAGVVRDVQFTAGAPGTYHYWASSHGTPLTFRALGDSQLSGAFIVDAVGDRVDDERIFVITESVDITEAQVAQLLAVPDPGAAFVKLRPDVLFAMNGRSWPFTERIAAEVGRPVRWRVVNLSTQFHPMHLHGFYFDVDSQGDGVRDRRFASGQRPHVVTQLMPPGGTMAMTWTPERAGQWLFHCHTMLHVSPTLRVDGSTRTDVDPHAGHAAGGNLGMSGLVLGVVVRETTTSAPAAATAPLVPRRIALDMREDPERFGAAPALGFVQHEDGNAGAGQARVPVPGPTLVLRRGEPVEITLHNQLGESTSIHWHGMELESFYDGVHGWSGAGSQLAPEIAAGERFVVRFTPPRSGTFIYHTHLHDNRQLTSGLYGALLVVDPETPYDDTRDHVVTLGRGGPALDAPVVLNGTVAPQLVWMAGHRHRLRLINITPNDIVRVTLIKGATPLSSARRPSLRRRYSALVRPMTSTWMPQPVATRGGWSSRALAAGGWRRRR